jgi:thermitase
LRVIGLLVVVCAAACAAEYVPGRLLVGRRGGTDGALALRTLRAHRASVKREMPGLGISVVEVPEETSGAAMESLRASGLFEYVERDALAHTAGDEPNDPSYRAEWHLPRIGSGQAWMLSTGAATAPVAVIDSGIFAAHPDLKGRLIQGWNFLNASPDTGDTMGHGTAVVGTIAAATNNGIGIASVNWLSPVMPLVVVDSEDNAAYSDIAAAIEFAAARGIRVVNISLGGRSESQTLQKAVDYAWNRGTVIFAAAMNNSSADPYYPAACQHVVAVSATDAYDHLAAFSNFGNWIAISAPGTSILSTADGGGYAWWNGTSFASPLVAGVAALCLAVNPELSAGELVALLERTADDLGPSGFDSSFGWGRLNAWRAVLQARPPGTSVASPHGDTPPDNRRAK